MPCLLIKVGRGELCRIEPFHLAHVVQIQLRIVHKGIVIVPVRGPFDGAEARGESSLLNILIKRLEGAR